MSILSATTGFYFIKRTFLLVLFFGLNLQAHTSLGNLPLKQASPAPVWMDLSHPTVWDGRQFFQNPALSPGKSLPEVGSAFRHSPKNPAGFRATNAGGTSAVREIRYISATGTNIDPATATSWAAATADLQGAIKSLESGGKVWVAAGTYKPTTGTDRTIYFSMKNNVAIYGGFLGNETVLSDRPAVNLTTPWALLSLT